GAAANHSQPVEGRQSRVRPESAGCDGSTERIDHRVCCNGLFVDFLGHEIAVAVQICIATSPATPADCHWHGADYTSKPPTAVRQVDDIAVVEYSELVRPVGDRRDITCREVAVV